MSLALTEWHYQETLRLCRHYLRKEYTIPCQIDALITRMYSAGFIDHEERLYISETVHTRDKLQQLLTKIEKLKKRTTKEAFEELLSHLNEDPQRPDIPKTLLKMLHKVGQLPPKQEEQLYDKVKRIEENFMYVSPFEVHQSLKLILTDYSAWQMSVATSAHIEGSDASGEDETDGSSTDDVTDGNVTETRSPLMQAVLKDDYRKLDAILDRCPTSDVINEVNSKGETAFMVACQTASHKFVWRFLMDGRVRVNATDKNGTTAFMHSVMRGDVEIIRSLLDCERLIVNARDNNQLTYVWYVFGKEVIQQLVSRVKVTNDRGEWRRVMENFGVTVKKLQTNYDWDTIANVVNVLLSSYRIDNIGLLKSMLLVGNETVISLILESGNVAITAENVLIILLMTIGSNNENIIKVVADCSNIPFHCLDDFSAKAILKYARRHWNSSMSELLVHLTKSPRVDKTLRLAISLMAMHDVHACATSTILEGYDMSNLNLTDKNGNTVFMTICKNGSYKLVAELLKYRNINILQKNAKYQTALMKSFKNNDQDVAILMLNHLKRNNIRLNLNDCDSKGISYLKLASEREKCYIIRTILDLDRNAKTRTGDEWRAIALARVKLAQTQII